MCWSMARKAARSFLAGFAKSGQNCRLERVYFSVQIVGGPRFVRFLKKVSS